jgi:hypothetical protein
VDDGTECSASSSAANIGGIGSIDSTSSSGYGIWRKWKTRCLFRSPFKCDTRGVYTVDGRLTWFSPAAEQGRPRGDGAKAADMEAVKDRVKWGEMLKSIKIWRCLVL